MRYIIAVLIAMTILILGAPVSADSHTWQRPSECEDSEREIYGNQLTPCRYVIPKLERIEYLINMEYPRCVEYLVFYLPDIKPLPDDHRLDYNTVAIMVSDPGTVHRERLNYRQYHYRFYDMDEYEWFHVADGYVSYTGYGWELSDSVGSSIFRGIVAEYPYMSLQLGTTSPGYTQSPSGYSAAVPYPDVFGVNELVNSCLALVAQEKADREHRAEIERQEQAESARLQVERDAAAKEEEQARLEAEAQARIAQQQLVAANERRLAVARTEEIRTQTLIDEVAHQEVITAILNDIVRIRLAGQEDRARITNEYLARARTASESFDLETSEIESRIQEYIDFNAALLAEIAEYQLSIQNRLEELRTSIQEQQDEIDRLEAEAQGIAAPAEELGGNTEEESDQNGIDQ